MTQAEMGQHHAQAQRVYQAKYSFVDTDVTNGNQM